MWFPMLWLGLGFALKWTREIFESFVGFFNKQRRQKMFDILYLILSFALIFLLVGHLHVTWGILLICLLFWMCVCIMVKAA